MGSIVHVTIRKSEISNNCSWFCMWQKAWLQYMSTVQFVNYYYKDNLKVFESQILRSKCGACTVKEIINILLVYIQIYKFLE